MGQAIEQLRKSVSAKVRLVTFAQFTAATGDSRTTIWRKVKRKELPEPFAWGNKMVWRESTLEKFMDKAAGKAG